MGLYGVCLSLSDSFHLGQHLDPSMLLQMADFILFQIGLFGVFLAVELYEFFIHFGYKFLHIYIIFKYFLSLLGGLFHFVDGFLCW